MDNSQRQHLPISHDSFGQDCDLQRTTMVGMDILVLSPTPTFPLDHGNRKRIYAWCQALRERGARIHFLFYPMEWAFSHVPADAVAAMQQQWDAFYLAPVTIPLYKWAQGDDHRIDEWWDPSIGNMLGFLFGRFTFDAFIINYPFFSKGFEWCPAHTLKILDTHDKFSGRRQLLEQNGIGKEFFYTTADQEKIALDRADLIWAIKEDEAEFFRTLTKKPVLTLPHAEAASPISRVRAPEDEDYLVVGMLGARNNINRKNAENFIKDARPLFRRQLAPIRIRLAGGMCDDLDELAALNGVDLMGRIDDVADFYRAVDVVIIPMSFSTGLKIKAIEAFSTGLPIVAHGHAVEGIPVEHLFHQCSSERQVAECCMELACDGGERLQELRAASNMTNQRLHVQFQAALEFTCASIRKRPGIVLTIAPQFFDRYSCYREHVLHLLEYLSHLAKITLYIDEMPVLPASTRFELFNSLGSYAKLVVGNAPAVQGKERLSETSMGLMHRCQSLSELLGLPENRTLWLESMPTELLQSLPARHLQIFIRIDSLINVGASESAVQGLLDALPSVNTVDTEIFPYLKGRGEHYPAPYFRRPVAVGPYTGVKRRMVLIIGTESRLPILHILYQFLVREPGIGIVVVVPYPNKDHLPPQPWAEDRGFVDAITSASDIAADLRKMTVRPSICVQCGEHPVLSVLAEVVQRLGSEVVPFSGSLYGYLENLMVRVTSGMTGTTSRSVEQYAADSGLTRVWKTVKSAQAIYC